MRKADLRLELWPGLDELIARGLTGEVLDERLAELRALRKQANGDGSELDRALLERIGRGQARAAQLEAGLAEAALHQKRIRAVHAKLTSPPFHPAVLLDIALVGGGPLALVHHANTRRVVAFGPGVDPATLAVGDSVLLGRELNVLLSPAPADLAVRTGETALFERALGDGRAVVRYRDEESVVRLAGPLRTAGLRRGDAVRWDQGTGLAYEAVQRSGGEHLFLEDTPAETFEAIGGLDGVIEKLKRLVRLHREHAEVASRYRLRPLGSVLLHGPPGTGKTMVGRALAHWLGEIAPGGRSRFMHVKPGGLHSMWFGQSENNIREAFRVARDAAALDTSVPVVMFWDEVDSIGAARGEALHRVEDRVLQALMVELNGLESRGNVLVVAATNRLDALDPGLVRRGRLGDLILPVPRPGREAARSILARYLRDDLPLDDAEAGARDRLLDCAVARLYSANGDGTLAELTFRDGRRHEVRARDVMSGARLERIVREASERAALRELAGGPRGIGAGDFEEAIVAELEDAARMLTPDNARRHLENLPQDVDVVRVEPARRKSARTHRYLMTPGLAGARVDES